MRAQEFAGLGVTHWDLVRQGSLSEDCKWAAIIECLSSMGREW